MVVVAAIATTMAATTLMMNAAVTITTTTVAATATLSTIITAVTIAAMALTMNTDATLDDRRSDYYDERPRLDHDSEYNDRRRGRQRCDAHSLCAAWPPGARQGRGTVQPSCGRLQVTSHYCRLISAVSANSQD